MKSKTVSASKQTGMSDGIRHQLIFFNFAFILLILIIYGRSIDYGFTLDDDYFYGGNKTVMQGITGIPEIFNQGSLDGYYGNEFQNQQHQGVYRPLTLSTFAIQSSLFGLSATSGHFINLMLYIVVAFLLFNFLRGFFSQWHVAAAGWITLLFIAHPVHTEVVCNIKSRDELLSALFLLSAFISMMKGIQSKKQLDFILSALWYLAALFSKESSIALLAIVPLIGFYKGINDLKSVMRAVLPWLIAAMAFLIIRHAVLGDIGSTSGGLSIYNSLNAAGDYSVLYGTRMMILLLFLKQSIFPGTLSYDYSFNQIPLVGIGSVASVISIALHLLCIVLIIRGIRKKNPVTFGLAFFFASSIVTNNFFFSIGSTFAERFLFLPVAGMLVVIYAILHHIIGKSGVKIHSGKIEKYCLLVILLVFTSLSYSRVPDWTDNQTLHLSGLKTSPNSARVHFDVGSDYLALAEQAQSTEEYNLSNTEAEKELLRSLEILPDYTDPLYNMGIISIRKGDTLQAMGWYKKAIQTAPYHHPSLVNTAYLHLIRGEFDSSLSYLNMLMKYHPNDNDALLNLSHLFYMKKDAVRSRQYAEKGMRLYPDVAFHYRNMAAACQLGGDSLSAKKYWDLYLYAGGRP